MVEITSSLPLLGLAAIFGYLLGSVPFGMVMARLFGLGDLRKIGSGNIGATNVLRTGNRLAAFLTLMLDAGKGGIAVVLMRTLVAEDAAILAGLAAFLGHLFPLWLGFKGGKGVATWLGTLLALSPIVGIAACLTWLAVAVVSRYSSLSALIAAVSGPVWAGLLGAPQAILVSVILAALIIERHRSNIVRLIAGTEPKIGKK
jgi:glycerol-3-phosphate acyltransferase PlsY